MRAVESKCASKMAGERLCERVLLCTFTDHRGPCVYRQMYNGYTCDQPLETRRTALRRWFDTDCQCSLCKHEEANGLYGGTEIKDAERREGDRSESSSEEEDDDDDDESSGDSDGSDSLLHPSACECEFCISSREFFERVRNGEWRADETLREFPEDEDGSFDPEMDCASME